MSDPTRGIGGGGFPNTTLPGPPTAGPIFPIDTPDPARASIPLSFAFCFFGLYESSTAVMMLVTHLKTLRLTRLTARPCSRLLLALAMLDHRSRMTDARAMSQYIMRISYGVNALIPLTELGLCYMSLAMVQALYNPKGKFYLAVRILAVFTILFDITVGSMGAYLVYMNNVATRTYLTVFGLFGMLATVSESAMSISCCAGFLRKLAKGLRVSFFMLIYELITKHNGQRFIMIIILRSVKVGMLVAVIGFSTSAAANSFNFIHSWLFGLEIAALVSFGFNTAKEMLSQHSLANRKRTTLSSTGPSQSPPPTIPLLSLAVRSAGQAEQGRMEERQSVVHEPAAQHLVGNDSDPQSDDDKPQMMLG
ncbi:hypothetical protein BC831DRAFT_469488 [Entophlyctis helioformis]|nr:hypothetical protein BC831DRAFT_469488 [Entophlyctis helioformis]